MAKADSRSSASDWSAPDWMSAHCSANQDSAGVFSKGKSATGDSTKSGSVRCAGAADAVVDRPVGTAVPLDREAEATCRVVANARRVDETRSRLAMVPIHREGMPPPTTALQQLQTRTGHRFISRQRFACNTQLGCGRTRSLAQWAKQKCRRPTPLGRQLQATQGAA